MTFLAIDSTGIYNSVVSILNEKGIAFEQSGSLRAKNRHSFSFKLTNEQALIGGDAVTFVLRVNNGNDGKTAFGFQLGLFRAICSNGLQIGVGENIRLIHRDCHKTLTFLQSVDRMVEETMEQRHDIIHTVETLQDIHLPVERAVQIVGNLNVSNSVKHTTIVNLFNQERLRADLKENTAWSLGNLINENIRYNHGRTWTADKQNKTLFEDILLLTA